MSRRRAAVPLLLGLLLAATSAPAAAQVDEDEPGMPDAPLEFRVAAAGSMVTWENGPGFDLRLDDALLGGLDVESRLGSFVGLRLGLAYGRGDIVGSPGRVEANRYLVDLSAVLRLGFGVLERAGVIPFGTVGAGTLVHDPEPPEIDTGGDEPTPLLTKSQNVVSYGGGLEIDPFERLGLRLEWRRQEAEVISVFSPTERSGTDREADLFRATVYWKL